MSRIGKLPIPVPKGVTVQMTGEEISVKGPKGELKHPIVAHIQIAQADDSLTLTREGDDRIARANHGLMRALVANMVTGVSKGFEKQLQIEGTGFRAEVKGKNLVMQLGYSHPVEYAIPSGITIAVDKQTRIAVQGIDKQQVGQVAANIRGFRPPDSYKGKGIRYADETLRLKEGKSA